MLRVIKVYSIRVKSASCAWASLYRNIVSGVIKQYCFQAC